MPSREAPRVLVVDDEPEIRQLVAEYLTSLHVRVESASNGREAIEIGSLHRPALIVTDLRLGDVDGLEVIDRLRTAVGDLPAVVITGHAEVGYLTEATRRRPIEVMVKPLDLKRLGQCVRDELSRQVRFRRDERRALRLRRLARGVNLQRKDAQKRLDTTCADLTEAYRALSAQLAGQQVSLAFQRDLLAARCDDDVFRHFFRLFAQRSGPLFGAALVCDANADLQIIGRFGVPNPDSPAFCQALVKPVIEAVLANPRVTLLDAGDRAELFDASVRRYLIGLSVLAIPLLPTTGEMIGLAVLYRKGEQPFTEDDLSLAELVGPPTAIAVKRND